MKHTATLTVRSYECDSYGHVNNAVYLNYLEYGRSEFLHAIGFNLDEITKEGYYLYITHVDIYYKASAFLNDKLFIDIEPTELKKVSGTFFQKIYKEDGTVCAEATVTWACVGSNGRPVRIPEKYVVQGLMP